MILATHPLTRFERRRRRVPIWPDHATSPAILDHQEMGRLSVIETRAVKRARAKDPRFPEFCEFFAAEYRKYGPSVRPGLLAICWLAGPGPHGILPELDRLIADRASAIDFIHWSAPDAGFYSYLYLAEAIEEFIELDEARDLLNTRLRPV
jgi:hypothetical protein